MDLKEEKKNVQAVEITPASVKSTSIQTDPIEFNDVSDVSKGKKTKNQKVSSSRSKKRKEKSFTRQAPEVLPMGQSEVITSRDQLANLEVDEEKPGQRGNMVKQLVRSYNKLLWFAAELEEQLNVKVLDGVNRNEIVSDENMTEQAISQVNDSINGLLGAVAKTIKNDNTKRGDVKLESKASENLKSKYTDIVESYKQVVSDYSGIAIDVGNDNVRINQFPNQTRTSSKEPIKSRLYRSKTDKNEVKNFKNRAIGRTNSIITSRGTLRSKSSVELGLEHMLTSHAQTRPPNNSPTGEHDHHIPYQVHPESISSTDFHDNNQVRDNTPVKRFFEFVAS